MPVCWNSPLGCARDLFSSLEAVSSRGSVLPCSSVMYFTSSAKSLFLMERMGTCLAITRTPRPFQRLKKSWLCPRADHAHHDLAKLVLLLFDLRQQGEDRGITEPRRARVVGEPEFQQAAQAAQVAIDAGQLADVLIVHDARDFVALADGQQVGRQAHAGRRRLFLNRSSFVWKAVHLDRWAALPGWLGFISHPLALICYAGGSRPASQSRIPVEHRQVRIRDSEEGTPARGWAYFTYPARLTPLDTPRKVYTNPLAKSCISCEKGWIYRKNRYNDPEAGRANSADLTGL